MLPTLPPWINTYLGGSYQYAGYDIFGGMSPFVSWDDHSFLDKSKRNILLGSGFELLLPPYINKESSSLIKTKPSKFGGLVSA